MSPHTPEIVTFILYLAAMLAIGSVFYRATRNLSDYVLGGRRLGGAVTALSAGASDMSGWLLLGLPGAIYLDGMNQSWIATGLTIGAYLNWQFVAKRLRRYTELANDSITLPDYLENRFEDRSRVLRVLSATVILLFFTVYTAAGLVAGAKLFQNTFGFPYGWALSVGVLAIVVYTFLGGFLAVSWTDFVQGLLMLAALMVVPVLAVRAVGEWDEVVSQVAAVNPGHIDMFSDMDLLSVVSLMAWGLGYFGQPHILARFMAIRSPQMVPQARLIGISWMVVSLLGAVFVGFVGIAYFADAPLEDSETVFIRLTQALLNPWVAGVLLAALLAAIMSTVDSQLLVCSSAITEDLYKAFFRRQASDRELVWIGRTAVVAVAVLASLIAWDPDHTVLGLVANAWAGFGASFGPVILLSLFWKRMTRNGALAGMLAGAVTVIIWIPLEGGLLDVYEIVPGFIAGALAAVIASLCQEGPPSTVQNRFEEMLSPTVGSGRQ